MTKYDFLIGKKISWTLQPPGYEVRNSKEGVVKEVEEIVKWGDNIPYWIGTLEREDGTIFRVGLEDKDVKIKIIKK